MMSIMTAVNARRAQLNRDAVLTATPARLLTMLYDRLLLDLSRAEIAQENEDWTTSTENLLHAQDIVAELSSSLKLDEWDGAQGLFGIYNFVTSALIYANTHRDIASTRICITLLGPLRETWHEAADSLPIARPIIEQPTGTLGVA